MRPSPLRRATARSLPGVTGPARVGRHVRALLPRLEPGDIAVLDALDMDRGSAQALVASGVAAVVNASPTSSGRYPNRAPDVLVAAGVPLVDGVGPGALSSIRDGEPLRLDDEGVVYRGSTEVARGSRQTPQLVRARMAKARTGLLAQLETFTAEAAQLLGRHGDDFLDAAGVPDVETVLAGRPVLVVTDHPACAAQLRRLTAWVRDCRPVLLGVGRGAEELRARGWPPDLVLGEVEVFSDSCLAGRPEVVACASHGGPVPGVERALARGCRVRTFTTGARPPEDAALLLASAQGASLVVVTGRRADLADLLDSGRPGMASAVLTRIRAGGVLVHADAVAELYRRRIGLTTLLLLVGATLVVVVAALVVAGSGRSVLLGASPLGQPAAMAAPRQDLGPSS